MLDYNATRHMRPTLRRASLAEILPYDPDVPYDVSRMTRSYVRGPGDPDYWKVGNQAGAERYAVIWADMGCGHVTWYTRHSSGLLGDFGTA